MPLHAPCPPAQLPDAAAAAAGRAVVPKTQFKVRATTCHVKSPKIGRIFSLSGPRRLIWTEHNSSGSFGQSAESRLSRTKECCETVRSDRRIGRRSGEPAQRAVVVTHQSLTGEGLHHAAVG
jgi:hypothetical protein